MNDEQGILLGSGTNELEIVTFAIGSNIFSINVLKVREIIHPTDVTEIPESHKAVEGVLQVRGEILPVINLAVALNIKTTQDLHKTKFIIAELNKMKVVFRVDEVHRIQRITWAQIEEPASLSMGLEETASGIIKLNDKIVLLLDFEKLIADINPNVAVTSKEINDMALPIRGREEKVIYVAEDSAMLRQVLENTLRAAGYTKLHFFSNGEDALTQIQSLQDVKKSVDLLITDIEMPKMDGHHLTKRVKDNEKTNHLPIVIFSSIISSELRHKGDVVGANAQVSKPEIGTLINAVDGLLFN